MENQDANGILEDFRIQFLEAWRRLPNKAFFFVLLGAWLLLFDLVGNSTLGYVSTPSLLRWMYHVYLPDQKSPEIDDQHGILVPLVVLGLFWWKRKELLGKPLNTWWPGLALIAFSLVLHIVGYAAQQPRVSIVALFTGIYGIMGLAWGWPWLRASFFPFFLFAFCVPLGTLAEPISFRLRLLVSQLVEVICHNALAIDVQRIGTTLRDPTGLYSYEVAAACSGMRSLIATVALSICVAFMAFKSSWRRLLLIGAAFPLAVLGNLVRMLTIVMAAELGGQSWGAYVHDGGPGGILSLLPYIPVFLGLMLFEKWLREPAAAKPAAAASGAKPLETQSV
jgi:exosortase